jgi:hypothetical protein
MALHVPVGTLAVNVMVLPAHTDVGPVMVPGMGNGFMVTIFVESTSPQLLVMV